MPQVDLTITISTVIAICAIISPVITTLLNNHHLQKIKKLELKAALEEKSYYYKRGIYEDYLRSVGGCVALLTRENLAQYGQIYPLALIYFPDSFQSDLIRINDMIVEHDTENAKTALNELSPKIREYMRQF